MSEVGKEGGGGGYRERGRGWGWGEAWRDVFITEHRNDFHRHGGYHLPA